MQRGYYIYYSSKTGFIGVDKKVDNQIKIFNQYTHCEKIVIEREKGNIVKSILWRLPFGSFGRHYEVAYDMIRNPDYIYIRFVPVDRKFLSFIKTLRKKFPLCKIILEVATYPYEKELLYNITMLPFYFKDRIYQKNLKNVVDRIVTYSDDSEIFGISAIRTMNGIIVNDVTMAKAQRDDNTIRLIAVAMLRREHGYERCIKGLAQYYQRNTKRAVEMHIVGDGSELAYYKKLVSQAHLEKYVLFYGRKLGKELDQLYNNADLALGFFGLYKGGQNTISALKTREYLAKGLPVVSGCIEDIMRSDTRDFFKIFPNDASVIDIQEIVNFYDDILEKYNSKEKIRETIRTYAKKNVDMSVVMKPVIHYIME